MDSVAEYLRSARPTAVSLPNAISYVMFRLRRANPSSLEEAISTVVSVSSEFVEYSKMAIDEIGKLGSKRLRNGDVVMTHCHSNAATSVLVAAHRAGKVNRVYVKETRPRLQGLVAARQLADAGLDVVLIPDSAVRYFMKDVDKVVVGAETTYDALPEGNPTNWISFGALAAGHEVELDPRHMVCELCHQPLPRTEEEPSNGAANPGDDLGLGVDINALIALHMEEGGGEGEEKSWKQKVANVIADALIEHFKVRFWGGEIWIFTHGVWIGSSGSGGGRKLKKLVGRAEEAVGEGKVEKVYGDSAYGSREDFNYYHQ